MATATATVTKTRSKTAPARAARMTLAEAMAALEAAGSEQTRRTYARHGVTSPMFGVSFATLKTLYKRIKVDHDLALLLWDTGNFDARNLAVKVVDPALMTPDLLDRWADDPIAAMCSSYVAHVTVEGPHAHGCVARWLVSPHLHQRAMGWRLVAALAMIDPRLEDAWFLSRLAEIEPDIHSVANEMRGAMNNALIAIGCRNAALRESATAASRRIGKVVIDHGDTDCKTPLAVDSIAKAWAHAEVKQASSPAAQERARESMRTRC